TFQALPNLDKNPGALAPLVDVVVAGKIAFYLQYIAQGFGAFLFFHSPLLRRPTMFSFGAYSVEHPSAMFAQVALRRNSLMFYTFSTSSRVGSYS
ncbi:hypothetical protein, partial [Acinetobacter baumannii]|uniref:hypothetical protein n=1 Tax=Acinetobacter baumannii TaxID=470 RepID=UPI001C068425